MTFEEAHLTLLEEFDDAVIDLRAVHETLGWTNRNRDYTGMLNRIVEIGTEIFELKNLWASAIKRLEEDDE